MEFLNPFNNVDSQHVAAIGGVVMMLLRGLKASGFWPQNKILAHLLSLVLSFFGAFATQQAGGSATEIAMTAAGAAVSATGIHEVTAKIGDAVLGGKPRNKFWSMFFPKK